MSNAGSPADSCNHCHATVQPILSLAGSRDRNIRVRLRVEKGRANLRDSVAHNGDGGDQRLNRGRFYSLQMVRGVLLEEDGDEADDADEPDEPLEAEEALEPVEPDELEEPAEPEVPDEPVEPAVPATPAVPPLPDKPAVEAVAAIYPNVPPSGLNVTIYSIS